MGAMTGMEGMAMDVNDIAFDAYLANDRTLDDPEVVAVDGRTIETLARASDVIDAEPADEAQGAEARPGDKREGEVKNWPPTRDSIRN